MINLTAAEIRIILDAMRAKYGEWPESPAVPTLRAKLTGWLQVMEPKITGGTK